MSKREYLGGASLDDRAPHRHRLAHRAAAHPPRSPPASPAPRLTRTDPIGRGSELQAIAEFLHAADARTLLLEGAAGIGKTTLWRAGLELAAENGYRILHSSPSGAEAEVSLLAVHDLIEEAFDEVAAELPEPQRRVLRVALLLEEPRGAPPQPRAIAVSVLGVLRALARRGPVLLAIDDAQWLDAQSQNVVEYAARRIRGEPVKLLLSVRVEDGTGLPPALEGVDKGRLLRLPVGPMSAGAIQHLVRVRLDTILPRSTLRRLLETSGGNPLFALELARVFDDAPDLEPGRLPVPDSLQELVRRRLEALPTETAEVLLYVAALARPTIAIVERALPPGGSNRLDPAFDAQILEEADRRIRFVHPLLASAVYAGAAPGLRRDVHRRLADAVADPEERARHLALGTDRPSSAIAGTLEAAATTAAARGEPGTAAELGELAATLTPDTELAERRRRVLEAASHHYTAGRFGKAEELVRTLLPDMPSGPERARALALSARAREENFETCVEIYGEALAEAAGDPRLEAEIHHHLVDTHVSMGDLGCAAEHARAAVACSEQVGDLSTVALASAELAHIESLTARITPGLLERGLELEEELGGLPPFYRPSIVLGLRLMFMDSLDEGRVQLERALKHAVELGEEYMTAILHYHLAKLELRAGNWSRAQRHADDLLAIFETSGSGNASAAFYVQALVAAHRGRIEDARAFAARSLAASAAAGERVYELYTRAALGVLELSVGDARAAVEQLDALPAIYAARGYGNPNVNPVLPNLIEALITLGETARAEELLGALEERGRALDSPWALATAARCRGLAAAARADPDRALGHFEVSLQEHKRLPQPFERARTLLSLGTVQRRALQRGAARAALEEALAVFEELGADLWAERARQELSRIAGRRATARGELTDAESRIAERVAEGRSNKEVAAALFVSVKTVEVTLTRVYRKLGIRSRAELVRTLLQETKD